MFCAGIFHVLLTKRRMQDDKKKCKDFNENKKRYNVSCSSLFVWLLTTLGTIPEPN